MTRIRSDQYCNQAGGDCVSQSDIYNIINNPSTPPPSPSTRSCTRDGVTVAHGDTQVFYSRTSASNCSTYAEALTCGDGSFDGSSIYRYSNCSAPAPVLRSCTLDDVTVAHGDSYRFYLQPVAMNCEFRSDLRTCNDGTFDGNSNYYVSSCSWGSPGGGY